MTLKLKFPNLNGMRNIKTKIPFTKIWELSEKRLSLLNSQPGCEERRLKLKARKKFKLLP